MNVTEGGAIAKSAIADLWQLPRIFRGLRVMNAEVERNGLLMTSHYFSSFVRALTISTAF